MTLQRSAAITCNVAILLVALSACSNFGSSRDVANPTLSGTSLAAQVCSNCHGLTGESTSPAFPKLAGQQKEYLSAQLIDFKGHDRKDDRGTQYMWGFTHLTDSQVNELADYFSAQAPMRGRSAAGATLARGEVIFSQGIPEAAVIACTSCHGPSAEGNGAIPRLAGQHASYIVEQIKVFQNTDQRPRGAAMKMVTHALSLQDTQAVALYLASMGASK